ncbi:MAG TPA: TRAP transporter large permease [Candidatus Limnocylindria bacterium]|nr:TRAP transporter large permease [Candidatus Limnocylindria bacterium]
MEGLILFGVFLLLVFLNVNIAVSLAVSSILTLMYMGERMTMVASSVYTSIGKYALLAIPFFILAGVIMEKAGISKRLIRFARVMVGHRKSGMIAVTVIVCCFFAAISGSGPATVAALGAILIPAMSTSGYNKGVSSALLASSGAIGIIIPPSIAYVVYASITGTSVAKLFMGGWLPGILLGISYVIAARWSSRHNKNIVHDVKHSPKERWAAFKEAVWGLLMPVIILGGIYGGVFTPTEAAGVAVIYGLVIGVFVYREIKLRDLGKLFLDAAVSSATVMFIVACAGLFTYSLSISGAAAAMSNAILSVSSNKLVLMLIINVIFLIAGCFVDANSAFFILMPIVTPIAVLLKLDMVHLGVFLTVNLAIGQITPPVGVNLYAAAAVGNISAGEIIRKITPFIICGIAALLIITYVPQLTLLLVNLL